MSVHVCVDGMLYIHLPKWAAFATYSSVQARGKATIKVYGFVVLRFNKNRGSWPVGFLPGLSLNHRRRRARL